MLGLGNRLNTYATARMLLTTTIFYSLARSLIQNLAHIYIDTIEYSYLICTNDGPRRSWTTLQFTPELVSLILLDQDVALGIRINR